MLHGSPILLKVLHQLFLRHENALKRVDCVNQMCMDLMIPETVHNGAPYGSQLQGLQWIFDNFKTRKSVILADEMGLGKTVQFVCFLSHIIKGSFTTSPALILAPKSILLQWKKEFGGWASDLNILVYQGDKDSRKCIQAHEMYSSDGNTLFDAVVTSYEFVQIDKSVLQKLTWSTIVIDEAHRLKRLDGNLTSCVKRYSSDFRLLLTVYLHKKKQGEAFWRPEVMEIFLAHLVLDYFFVCMIPTIRPPTVAFRSSPPSLHPSTAQPRPPAVAESPIWPEEFTSMSGVRGCQPPSSLQSPNPISKMTGFAPLRDSTPIVASSTYIYSYSANPCYREISSVANDSIGL